MDTYAPTEVVDNYHNSGSHLYDPVGNCCDVSLHPSICFSLPFMIERLLDDYGPLWSAVILPHILKLGEYESQDVLSASISGWGQAGDKATTLLLQDNSRVNSYHALTRRY